MHDRGITRRMSLLLPFVLAACGGEEPRSFPTLRYQYLPPIGLNVANIRVEQHFIPSGVPPDVTNLDPARPSDALGAMAEDRLKALGSTGTAVFVIQDASLVKQGDVITGTMDVLLNIYPAPDGPRVAFAEARVTRQRRGSVDDLPSTLYDMTKAMMDAMNVEFEYQVRRRLRDWLATGTAVVPPVQAQPLEPGPGTAPPGAPYPPPPGAPSSGPPSAPPFASPLTMPGPGGTISPR